MRISRMDDLGGSWPPVNPSMSICPPLGPAEGPASAWRSDCRSSGSSESASRSFPLSTMAPALLLGLTLTAAGCSATSTFSCCTAIESAMLSLASANADVLVDVLRETLGNHLHRVFARCETLHLVQAIATCRRGQRLVGGSYHQDRGTRHCRCGRISHLSAEDSRSSLR